MSLMRNKDHAKVKSQTQIERVPMEDEMEDVMLEQKRGGQVASTLRRNRVVDRDPRGKSGRGE